MLPGFRHAELQGRSHLRPLRFKFGAQVQRGAASLARELQAVAELSQWRLAELSANLQAATAASLSKVKLTAQGNPAVVPVPGPKQHEMLPAVFKPVSDPHPDQVRGHGSWLVLRCGLVSSSEARRDSRSARARTRF